MTCADLSIGVLSDSHGNVDLVRRVLRWESRVTRWVRCGDGCRDLARALAVAPAEGAAPAGGPEDAAPLLVAVSGNCDSPTWAPRECVFEASGTRFLVIHGDRQHVQLDFQKAVDEAHRAGAHVVLYGHTHRADYRVDEGIHLFNPGSLQRGGRALSYGRVTLRHGRAPRFEIERVPSAGSV